jgi:hypothetical protein
MQSMLFVGNLQIINIIETSNHCFLIKNKENDMSGIVQLKVKSLKLHGYIIYYKHKTLVVISTDCIGSSNYHTITTTMTHSEILEGRT